MLIWCEPTLFTHFCVAFSDHMVNQVTCVLENGEVGSLSVTLAEAEGISQPGHFRANGVQTAGDLPPGQTAGVLSPSQTAGDLQPGQTAGVLPPSQTAGVLHPSQTAGVLQPSQAGEFRTAIIHKYCLIILLILNHLYALWSSLYFKNPNCIGGVGGEKVEPCA